MKWNDLSNNVKGILEFVDLTNEDLIMKIGDVLVVENRDYNLMNESAILEMEEFESNGQAYSISREDDKITIHFLQSQSEVCYKDIESVIKRGTKDLGTIKRLIFKGVAVAKFIGRDQVYNLMDAFQLSIDDLAVYVEEIFGDSYYVLEMYEKIVIVGDGGSIIINRVVGDNYSLIVNNNNNTPVTVNYIIERPSLEEMSKSYSTDRFSLDDMED